MKRTAAYTRLQTKFLPPNDYTTIKFSVTQTVYLVKEHHSRLHRRIIRYSYFRLLLISFVCSARVDEWRRYGAMRTIHEHGGWISTVGGSRKNRKVRLVAAGSAIEIPEPSAPSASSQHSRLPLQKRIPFSRSTSSFAAPPSRPPRRRAKRKGRTTRRWTARKSPAATRPPIRRDSPKRRVREARRFVAK